MQTADNPIAGKKVNPILLLAALGLLAILAIALAFVMIAERRHLLHEGRLTDGIVIAIDVGIKGLKSAEARFTRGDGRVLIGRDIHRTQWFAANEVGDAVRLYYDPFYEGDGRPDILIDRGAWIWSNPAFLLLAGAALLLLGILILRKGI